MPIIKVENLSKKYILSHQQQEPYTALRDVITERFKGIGRKLLHPFTSHLSPFTDSNREDFWALKDVSFEIKQGDRVGIIGRNGAGKSTLLKILSRITEPTSGRVSIRGRVASLLEVGTGFHPELTGRENISLNGAILGMGRVEIKRKFDEIVAFAEVERFLDTPVKHYSSGMYVRLAFAVAAHLEPEILVVDEVLAVGDAQFQKKCLGKMEDVSVKEGRTVLFVSHNMPALKSLCERAIWLNSGCVVLEGEVNDVVSNYLQDGASAVLEQKWDDIESAPGNDKVRLHKVTLVPESDEQITLINISTPLKMEFEFWNFIPDANLNLSLHIFTIEGTYVLASASSVFVAKKGLVRGVCSIPGDLLNDGIYRAQIMIVQDSSVALYTHDDVLVFEVHEKQREGNWYGKWPGVVRPNFAWDINILG